MAKYTYSDFDGLMERQQDGDITLDTDLDAIKNSLQNILSTRKGSRRMLPEFGGTIEEMLFEPMDEITARRIANDILAAIQVWDSRIEILGIDMTVNYDYQQYEVDMSYTIKGFGAGGQDNVRLILKRL
jgi:phage baseplate assembly protein W